LPTDPLNKINGCGDAELCKNHLTQSCRSDSDSDECRGAGPCQSYKFDSNTCWSVDSQIYRCPAGSHIYQYKLMPDGTYEIGADLEYQEAAEVDPSWSWFRAIREPRPIPAYVSYENTCTDAAIYENGGACGDGAIGTGEACEPGTVNVCKNNTAKSCTSDAGCTASEGPCLLSEQNCDPDGTGPLANSAGRQSRNCNLATCQWNDWGSCTTNCGNGILDPGEACDRGPGGGRIPGGGTGTEFTVGGRTVRNEYNCSATCQVEGGYCGDGSLQSGMGERCDDGTAPDGTPYNGRYGFRPGTTAPYCATGCTGAAPYCGDRIVDADASAGEKCDGNSQTTSGLCRGTINPCSSSTDCGDGGICDQCPIIGGYPQTNTRNCTSVCAWDAWIGCRPAGSCGNGIKEGSEECDDGNTNNNDSCTSACLNARCGDGYIKTGVEMCDAGTANGTICTAPYGSTCNYCSTSCTLRTATGPTCGDGTVQSPPEQCDGGPLSQNWICVDYSNPWFSLTPPPPVVTPTCPAGVCQVTCSSGRACYNTISRDASGHPTNDVDNDGVSDLCDPNDDSSVDGCLDTETNCADIGMIIGAATPPGAAEPNDTFNVYIDGHLIGQVGRTVVFGSCRIISDGYGGTESDCDHVTKIITINRLRRGTHNIRIIYSGTNSSPAEGMYQIVYNSATVEWGLDSWVFVSGGQGPNPQFTALLQEISRDFEVR
jgi:cysteine-rich repeat protein